jgi:hypothetical protein
LMQLHPRASRDAPRLSKQSAIGISNRRGPRS